VKAIESVLMISAGRVARKVINACKFSLGNLIERDHLIDLVVDNIQNVSLHKCSVRIWTLGSVGTGSGPEV
jgi:hypothetical protein